MIKPRIAGIVVAASLLGGAAFSSTAMAAPAPVAVSSSAFTSNVNSAGVATTGPATGAPTAGTTSSSVQGAQAGAAARAVVAALKKHIPALYNELKSAVKSGYKAFMNVWNKIPGWIRSLAGAVSSSAIYDWLKDNIGSW